MISRNQNEGYVMLYSVDFRKKIMEHLETSTIHETAQRFKIAASSIIKWKKLLKETGSLKPIKVIRKPRKIDYVKLREYVEKYPDKYLREIAEVFKVSLRGIDYAFKKMKISLKKRPKYTKNGMKRGERSISRKYQNTREKI
jgi:transposase